MPTIEDDRVEIRIKGRWVRVPAVDIGGRKLIAEGRWLKIAVVRSESMLETELENPDLYIEKLKVNNVLKADIFTFTQKLPSIHPKYSFAMERESIAAIHVVSFNKWWQGLPQETRKNVRRSQRRGVTVRIRDFDDELIQGIRGVNDESPMRQGTRNGYYGKSSEETKRLYGEFVGRCDFICAYVGEEMIGFLHLVYRKGIASILNLTTKPSHFDKRPANALLAKAVETCEEKGISHLSYGLYNYGNKRDDSLRTFKIRNGFEEILMPRYFVPLNRWGDLCMKAKLHRGLIGILPHEVIKLVIVARSVWHNFVGATISRYSLKTEQPKRNRQMECSIPPTGSNLASD
jgi:hypothetical protein